MQLLRWVRAKTLMGFGPELCRLRRIHLSRHSGEEGSRFESRAELSEAGVHKPTVADISGSEREGADSISSSGRKRAELEAQVSRAHQDLAERERQKRLTEAVAVAEEHGFDVRRSWGCSGQMT